MDQLEGVEGERGTELEVFHVFCQKANSDKHLTLVAANKIDAETKLGNFREFANTPCRIYSAEELKSMHVTLFVYEYVNGSRSEKTISILAQSIEEAREKLTQRIGTKIKIIRARTKRLS